MISFQFTLAPTNAGLNSDSGCGEPFFIIARGTIRKSETTLIQGAEMPEE